MATISFEREHNLSSEESHELALNLGNDLVASQGGSIQVDGNRIQYRHISGSKGTVTSEEGRLLVKIKLSFVMLGMKKMIESELERICDKYLES